MLERIKIDCTFSLANTNPDLALEWYYEKNRNITPHQISAYDKTFVWWKCKNSTNHEWLASVYSRNIENRGCPYCQQRIH